jgi:hypothetical protein
MVGLEKGFEREKTTEAGKTNGGAGGKVSRERRLPRQERPSVHVAGARDPPKSSTPGNCEPQDWDEL